MKVLVFGATGMIGQGVLRQCLGNSEVTKVLSVGRRPCGIVHEKLEDCVKENLFAYDDIAAKFSGFDACFFCLGISAAGLSEEAYTKITYELTLKAAAAFIEASPEGTFIYVSATGADCTEKGKIMWARVRGRTENALIAMGFPRLLLFRPGLIQPLDGIRSRTPLYRWLYTATGPLLPLVHQLLPEHITTTRRIGDAMLHGVKRGYPNIYLENKDINCLATPDPTPDIASS